jgi:hypothetical protein
MIGQFDKFDYKKFTRDFRKDFFGIEACMLQNEKEINSLIYESHNYNFKIGIHFPLRAGISKLRDPQFTSSDEKVRNDAFKTIEEELKTIRNANPEYVLFHYPKPVILDTKVDWSNWRFADKSDYVFENEYSYEELSNKSEYLFQWLSSKSNEYNFVPVLELDGLNKYIYGTDLLEKLLDKYPQIKLCLDTGRLHLQEKLDKNFNAKDVLKRYSKYVYVIHLWNIRVQENLEKSHFPVLPGLKEEDGWADIYNYLSIIKSENKNCKLLFEHRSDLISDNELDECYSWVDKLYNL